jgi:hypothetical protein
MNVYVVVGDCGSVYNVFETAEDAVKYVVAVFGDEDEFKHTAHRLGDYGDIIHSASFWNKQNKFETVKIWRKGVKGYIGCM